MAQILPMSNAAIARALAFERLGVTLRFPARSRSGVRGDDGTVVFAMPAAAVRTDDWGCSCPLWLPGGAVGAEAMDRAISLETIGHCRLAVRHGGAEGFVVHAAEGAARAHEMLSLRVVKAGSEYWARWGCAARGELPGRRRRSTHSWPS